MSLFTLITEARRSGDFAPLAAAVPYARYLGIGAELTGGELLGRMRFAPHLVGNASLPALHGGTIGALLESTAIFQLLYQAETPVLPRTVTITVDYLRSARALDTLAHGVVTRQGRRVASVHVEAWQEDRTRLVATANVHLMLAPLEGPSAPET